MPRPTGEKYLGSGDRNHLASERPANAVAQRNGPFHCRRSAQHRAVLHEEIGLHPARAARRNRNGLSIPSAPAPQPDHDEVALRRRRCKMDLHRRSISHSGQRGRSVGAQERDRTFRSVSNRDDHSEASPRNQPISIPSGPDDPSPQRRLPGPADTPPSAVKGRAPAPHPATAALRTRIAPENATAMGVR